MRLLLILCAAATAFPGAEAVAQMRSELPEVEPGYERPGMPEAMSRRMDPDPEWGMRQSFDDFGAWNRRSGAPKILFFWNRELTDDSSSRYRTVNRSVSAIASRPGLVVGVSESTTEDEATTGGEYSALHSEDSADLESGFLNAFLSTGANILDRRALMRKVSTGPERGDRSDKQYMESQALEQGVDYLVEVLPNPDANTETGFLFTVKITHLPSSTIKAQFRTAAAPMRGPARLVAGPGGYQRRIEDRTTPENVARTLAAETMRTFY
ncbi:hypothetical protein [Parasphingorhabdus sp.]|uniref:hypothetical protein n=1 Tax=Parasphingorhabdus sp. TaxID=2709688 RepID=UPI003594096E